MNFVELTVRYRGDLSSDAGIDLSSTIRGVWGRGLRRAYCLQRNVECAECPFENCTYYAIFEKKYGEAGQYHPYIIEPLELDAGSLSVAFKFLGWVCNNPGQILMSIMNTNESVIHSRGMRVPLQLESVTGIEGLRLYTHGSKEILAPKPETLKYLPGKTGTYTLDFVTPLRQKSGGNLMTRFVWDAFAKSLIVRLRYLDRFFNNGRLGIPERLDIGSVVVRDTSLTWQERFRRSFRQGASMSLGGLAGTARLENVSPEMAAILRLGSRLHAGKQCSFGNGHYIVSEG